MPELPEVELYQRYFARHALRQKIAAVRVLDARVLGAIRKDRLARALKGRAFKRVHRHGKHLFADAGAAWLHLHFGMTGDLAYYREEQPRFARIVFDFTNGAHLAFEDMRLFGVVDLTASPEAYIEEHGLGPDPMDSSFRLPLFRRLLEKKRGAIKAVLMSQDVMAGVGNLYADEALFQASIDPRRAAEKLEAAEVRSLFTALRRILREVIRLREADRELPSRYLFLHRAAGEDCPRCGGAIRRAVVFGRTTYYCPRHQR